MLRTCWLLYQVDSQLETSATVEAVVPPTGFHSVMQIGLPYALCRYFSRLKFSVFPLYGTFVASPSVYRCQFVQSHRTTGLPCPPKGSVPFHKASDAKMDALVKALLPTIA